MLYNCCKFSLLLSPIVVYGLPSIAQVVKNPLAMPETLVQSLHWEYPLEKELTSHSSILAMDNGNPMDRGAWWVTDKT